MELPEIYRQKDAALRARDIGRLLDGVRNVIRAITIELLRPMSMTGAPDPRLVGRNLLIEA